MRLDIFKRSEDGGRYSYLAVPEGKEIPNEAVNADWQTAEKGFDFDSAQDMAALFEIDDPMTQIRKKGYAITSVKQLSGNHPDL